VLGRREVRAWAVLQVRENSLPELDLADNMEAGTQVPLVGKVAPKWPFVGGERS
jgi:hypothetical protein